MLQAQQTPPLEGLPAVLPLLLAAPGGQSWSWSLTDPPFLSQQLLGASVSTESSFTVHVQGAQPHTCNAALQFFVLQDKSFCIFPLLTYLHLPLAFHGIWVR